MYLARKYQLGTLYFTSPTGDETASEKGVPSFLGYFKTQSIGPAPGIEPATSCSAVNTLYRLS